jgi:hypothetical protein
MLRSTAPQNHLAIPIALIVLGAIAGALLGVALFEAVGPLWAAIGAVIPPVLVSVNQFWRSHQESEATRREIRRLKAETDPRRIQAKLTSLMISSGYRD